jgi:two-component system, response regulator, stage 0 sporulation protein F
MPQPNDARILASIPELGAFDEAMFDDNPLWHAIEMQRRPLPAVLVVDDDPTIVALLQRVMQSTVNGYDIIATTNPTEALEHLGRRAVSLVVTDFNMPGLNGLQLTARIKAYSPATCVLLISAYATPAMERQALNLRVDYYLPKPFQLAQLEQVAGTILMARAH